MTDPYLWLEDIEGEAALDWVREQNRWTEDGLMATDTFSSLRARLLAILEADDRLVTAGKSNEWAINFWTDAEHPRGLIRQARFDDYLAGTETWDVLLDVTALGESEGASFVLHSFATCPPDKRRALIALSPGGGDSHVVREFDLDTRQFVPADEGGFALDDECKSQIQWVDLDTVLVATDTGPESLTRSGYPRQVRRWHRGTALADAEVVFEAPPEDALVTISVSGPAGDRTESFMRWHSLVSCDTAVVDDDGVVRVLDLPADATPGITRDLVQLAPRSDVTLGDTTFPAGSLLLAPWRDVLAGTAQWAALFTPSPTTALEGSFVTDDGVWVTTLDDVRNHVVVHRLVGDRWTATRIDDLGTWSAYTAPVSANDSGDCWLIGTDHLTPTTLSLASPDGAVRRLRSAPARFDTDGLRAEQRFATSADGTRIPFFLVGPDTDEPLPTLLTGYGGFEIANTASYSGLTGAGWLERGYRYALANLRGGGEYGPAWHQAGLRENRHRVYEDLEAVTRALIDDGRTTPSQLGVMGGSNGGLLVGNALVRTPELYGAIVCQVPLLDMQRYHLLLAGASWMSEYGDPDSPSDWEFMQTWSPYQLATPDADYPPILLATSTRDDRVHPGHARKMAARLTEMGHDVTYWENIEGGHGGAADAPQQATMWALTYTFLLDKLAQA